MCNSSDDFPICNVFLVNRHSFLTIPLDTERKSMAK